MKQKSHRLDALPVTQLSVSEHWRGNDRNTCIKCNEAYVTTGSIYYIDRQTDRQCVHCCLAEFVGRWMEWLWLPESSRHSARRLFHHNTAGRLVGTATTLQVPTSTDQYQYRSVIHSISSLHTYDIRLSATSAPRLIHFLTLFCHLTSNDFSKKHRHLAHIMVYF